jgi:hypothetical protein
MGLTAACVETYETRGLVASYRVIVICSKFVTNFHPSSEEMNYSCSLGRLGDRSMEREFCGVHINHRRERQQLKSSILAVTKLKNSVTMIVLGTALKEMRPVTLFRSDNVSG